MSQRFRVIVLWGLVVAVLLQLEGGSDGPRRPAPKLAHDRPSPGTRPLPAPSWRDPSLRIVDDDADRGVYSGSAFAVDDQGHWVTARHVVAGCRQLAILTQPRHGVRVTEVASHPRADVALLASGPSAPALRMGAEPLFLGQDGFHMGFPRGESGDVHGALMGRVNLRRRLAAEPGLLWAEIDRAPAEDGSLGGLSGGPVVDRAGHVIGVAIAASPRRGRVISAPPESLREVMTSAGLDDAAPESVRPDDVELVGSNYAAFGDRLRRHFTVAKVLCWDRDAPSRRPRLRWG